MKKVLIAVSQLRVGGVSKALIELLKNICDKCEVTLLCFDHDGAFYSDIPEQVKIVEDNAYLALTERSAGDLQQYGSKYKVIRQVCSAWTKRFNKKIPANYICNKVGKIDGVYDIAIAFGHPQQENIFCNLAGEVVINCVNANKKAIVIHCDYEMYGGHCTYNDKLLLKFDKIAAVSKSVGAAVIRCIPEAEDKICVLRNFHDFKLINEMASQDTIEYRCENSLVTVARLSGEKGLERGIEIVKELKMDGYDVEWHIVGGGPLRSQLEHLIGENHADDYIVLEGEQVNPYRYIKGADYLFVPSIHEAAPMVFDEAASLKVPVISTDTLSARELVEDRKIGLVGETEHIKELLKYALDNKGIFKSMVLQYESSNTEALHDFESLCDK